MTQRITAWALEQGSSSPFPGRAAVAGGRLPGADRLDEDGGTRDAPSTGPPTGADLRRDLALRPGRSVYEQRAFWRNRHRAFFSFLFPLMFLVIFATISQRPDDRWPARRGSPTTTYFVPGILAYGVISTTFVNMAISTSILREQGVLKRMQARRCPAGPTSPAASARRSGDRGDDDRVLALGADRLRRPRATATLLGCSLALILGRLLHRARRWRRALHQERRSGARGRSTSRFCR